MDVRISGAELFSRHDTPRVVPLLVGSRHKNPFLQGDVGDDREFFPGGDVHRADETCFGADKLLYFIPVGGTEVPREAAEFLFVKLLVAPD